MSSCVCFVKCDDEITNPVYELATDSLRYIGQNKQGKLDSTIIAVFEKKSDNTYSPYGIYVKSKKVENTWRNGDDTGEDTKNLTDKVNKLNKDAK